MYTGDHQANDIQGDDQRARVRDEEAARVLRDKEEEAARVLRDEEQEAARVRDEEAEAARVRDEEAARVLRDKEEEAARVLRDEEQEAARVRDEEAEAARVRDEEAEAARVRDEENGQQDKGNGKKKTGGRKRKAEDQLVPEEVATTSRPSRVRKKPEDARREHREKVLAEIRAAGKPGWKYELVPPPKAPGKSKRSRNLKIQTRDLMETGAAYSNTARAFKTFRPDNRKATNLGTSDGVVPPPEVDDELANLDNYGEDLDLDLGDLALDEEEFPAGIDPTDFVAMATEAIMAMEETGL
ncbi:hypothetical protein C8R47DRAFT_1214053 [Mycena vitilis]|nr:hypothetical protein C8R47DRAFT_1214053 [Mycena vitilis]